MQLIDTLKELAARQLPEVRAMRRHLHKHPELSFQEHETMAFIAEKLTAYGIPFTSGIAGTGLVALIEGQDPNSKITALRADMDALPIQEVSGREHGSVNAGVMHACGHDAHTASLLGAANILMQTRDKWKGTVKLIFQPGEEKLPGGASLMIKDGALQNPAPSSIFGQHVTNLFGAGKVGFRSGLYMASTDELYLTIFGKGGHAAIPATYNNPLLIASKVLLALNDRFMNPDTKNIPDHPTVLAFGKIIGQGATNVIPDKVVIDGTFRTMNEAWRDEAHRLIMQIATETAEQMGGKADLEIIKGYPFLVNDVALTERARQNAIVYLGAEHVIDLDRWMAAEDFAYYSQVMPACFYRFGIRNESQGITSSVHTSNFDIDEEALITSTGLMAWLAIAELRH